MFKNNAALLALKLQMQGSSSTEPAFSADARTDKPLITGKVEFLPSGAFLFTESGDRFAVEKGDSFKCLPGDHVEARVTSDGGLQILSLVETAHTHVVGSVRFSGEHRFIDADDRRFKGGFFIPHSCRADEKDGDIVYAKIVRHPFETGKAQAAVENTIAESGDKTAIWKLALFKMQIGREYPGFEAKQLELANRKDYTHIPFITIDGESTRDMDDALYAEARPEGGWRVLVAIADPDAYLHEGGELDEQAKHRAATSYLPGMTTGMLPAELSEDLVSLMANKIRPVILAQLEVDELGTITSQAFEIGLINSRLRLSYLAVNDYLSGEYDLNAARAIKESIRCLFWFSKARQKWRKDHALSQSGDDADYRIDLSDYQVSRITKDLRNDAHKLVEEAMVAANIAFATYADQNAIPVISRTQSGFHPKALDSVNHIATIYGLEPFVAETPDFDKTLQLLRKIGLAGDPAHEIRMRSTFMASQYSTEPGYHASLGLKRYATFTSPIRKYTDLINHRQLKAFLCDGQAAPIDQDLVANLNERNKACAQGEREVTRKLYAKHFSFLAAEPVDGVVVGIRNRYLDVSVCGARFNAEVRFEWAEVRPTIENDPASLCMSVNGVERIRLGDTVTLQMDLYALERGELKGIVQATP